MTKLSDKEIESASSLEPFERYEYFIKRIADSEKLYTLHSKKGDWAISDIKNLKLYPLWSAQEYALRCAVGVWGDFNVVEFELNNFLDEILSQIIDEGFLLNIFSVGDKTGFIVNKDEFVRDINKELEKYK